MNDARLTPRERSRYEICKKQIADGLQTVFDTGTALTEVRDQKLYREEFETFEDFCQQTYQIGKAYAYRLIEAADVKDGLEKSPMGDKITNERQTRELAKVPESKREKVLNQIVKSGDPVTAETIKEKAAEIIDVSRNKLPARDASEVKEKALDKEGWPIPKPAMEVWIRRHEIQNLITGISRIKCHIEKAREADDVLYRTRSAQRCVSDLEAVHFLVSQFMPHSVCPGCQGQTPDACTWCSGRGFISEQEWNAPDDELKQIKKMREAQLK